VIALAGTPNETPNATINADNQIFFISRLRSKLANTLLCESEYANSVPLTIRARYSGAWPRTRTTRCQIPVEYVKDTDACPLGSRSQSGRSDWPYRSRPGWIDSADERSTAASKRGCSGGDLS
jgi:hypothetical protein